MHYLEMSTTIESLRLINRTIDERPKLVRALRRIHYSGEMILAAILLARCGQPLQIPPTTIPDQSRPTTAVGTEGTAQSLTPIGSTPVSEATPNIEAGRQLLFDGFLDIADPQRLGITQNDSEVVLEAAGVTGISGPRFRNIFKDAIVSEIYDKDTEIGRRYGPSICLLVGKNQKLCINNLYIISEDARSSYANKTPLPIDAVLGSMGLTATLPNYPNILPDSNYRSPVSAFRDNNKVPLQQLIPGFTPFDTRQFPSN